MTGLHYSGVLIFYNYPQKLFLMLTFLFGSYWFTHRQAELCSHFHRIFCQNCAVKSFHLFQRVDPALTDKTSVRPVRFWYGPSAAAHACPDFILSLTCRLPSPLLIYPNWDTYRCGNEKKIIKSATTVFLKCIPLKKKDTDSFWTGKHLFCLLLLQLIVLICVTWADVSMVDPLYQTVLQAHVVVRLLGDANGLL